MSVPVPSDLQLVALVGSLRAASINRAIFEAARDVAPANLSITEAPIGRLPFFDQDLEASLPEAVEEFHALIRPADGVLIFTPEYNYSIPGVLKNAIDWGSRPSGNGTLNGKPVMIFGASGGRSGAMRAQMHLRTIVGHLDMPALPKPEYILPFAGRAMEEGRLVDPKERQRLAEMLVTFSGWVRLLKLREEVIA